MPTVSQRRYDKLVALEEAEKKAENQVAPPPRIQVLQIAAQLTGKDREEVYGNSYQNMNHFAGLLRAYFAPTEKNPDEAYRCSAEDAAMVMVLAKLSRIAVGKFHKDNYIDAAAYIAIAEECREIEEAV